MRELKFRAWNIKKKWWERLFNYCLTLDGSVVEHDYCSEGPLPDVSHTNEFILCQFTGLLDKNRKEIYEGDIIIRSKNFREVVEWDPVRMGWLPFVESTVLGREPEVIGNIFENPELVK